MRSMIFVGLAAIGLAGCAHKEAGTADAGATPASAMAAGAMGAAAPQGSNNVCLHTYLIDHTQVLDDSTILFYMRGHDVWKNSLPFPCFGLKVSGGFQYSTSINELCSNLEIIHVIEQGGGPRLGATCSLGVFTPYTPTNHSL